MLQRQFKKAVEAGLITAVDIMGCPDDWRIVLTGPATALADRHVETARGGIRKFKTLDSAYAVIWKCGWKGNVGVIPPLTLIGASDPEVVRIMRGVESKHIGEP